MRRGEGYSQEKYMRETNMLARLGELQQDSQNVHHALLDCGGSRYGSVLTLPVPARESAAKITLVISLFFR
jgi:hypothetical protein